MLMYLYKLHANRCSYRKLNVEIYEKLALEQGEVIVTI